MRPHDLIPIRFEDEDEFPMFASGAPAIMWTSKSTSVESFLRARRKAASRGLRLLSYHFSGAKFVAQFGV